MKYKRLPFEQYFIDTSRDFHHTGDYRFKIDYDTVYYKHKGKTYEANYKIRWDAKRKVIQIYFQDTDGKLDWKANFDFPAKMYGAFDYEGKKIKFKVHRGWKIMWFAMKHEVRAKFEKLYKRFNHPEVEIIGWSLGSSQAQLCAQDLNYNYGVKAHVFTFGSVKPFRKIFFSKRIKNYLKDCCAECYNFSDVNDVVTYMPPFNGYFKINNKKTRLDKFSIFRLFNPMKYHTCYDNEEIY